MTLRLSSSAPAAATPLLRWAPNSKGQTKVEYADGPSPNRADALMIAFAPVPVDTSFNYKEAGMTSEATW